MLQQQLRRLRLTILLILAPALLQAQTPEADSGTQAELAKLAKTKPALVNEFKRRLELAKREIEAAKRGYLVFGRIALEGGGEPRAVVSQMIILEDGYFVDAVGFVDQPVGFRLHGYESLNVLPEGPEPTDDWGVIELKKTLPDQGASAKGKIQIESRPGAPRLDQVQLTWTIMAESVNTPTGGTEGMNQFHQPALKSKVAADGTFSASGMSDARYQLEVKAPGCSRQFRSVEFQAAESRELEPIVLEISCKMNVEFAVSADGDFHDAKFSKVNLAADDRWRTNDEIPKYGFDLEIGQKDGKLLLNYRYAPCFITDLGAAELTEKLDVGPADSTKDQPQEVPVVDGHVYLVHQSSWKRWILFRTSLLDADER